MTDHGLAYNRFVAELALHPDMVSRLLAWHPAVGVCDACGLPGGQIAIAAPCSMQRRAHRTGKNRW